MINRSYRYLMIFLIASTFVIISNAAATTDYSEMTDEELIDRFEKILNTDVDLTMQDMMDKIKDGEMTDALAEELVQRMAELWSESKRIVEEPGEIAIELQKRGIDVEAGVLTTDDSMNPMITISKPILTHELVEEYNSLIDKFDKLGTHSEQLEITQELISSIKSDLERFENIVISLQNLGYDGLVDVDLVDDQIIGTTSFFDKYTFEPLFKRQIPSGTINIFGTMGLIKEFDEGGGTPISYEQQVILLSSSASIGAIATFSGPSDPDYEISSGMVLAAIGGYHPTVDNTKNSDSDLSSLEKISSPKFQEKSGTAPLDTVCKEGLQKIFKSSDNSPTCVKSQTAEKLIQRGWVST